MNQFKWDSEKIFNKHTVVDFGIKTAPVYIEGYGILPSPAYYPNESFSTDPNNTNYLIGNRGTIYSVANRCKVSNTNPIYISSTDLSKLPKDENTAMSEIKVHRICSLIAQGLTQNQVIDTLEAEGLGKISRATFWYIRNKDKRASKWFYIIDQYDFSNAYSNRSFDDETIKKVYELSKKGCSNIEIGEAVGIYDQKAIQNLITRIKNGYRNDILGSVEDIKDRKDWKGEPLVDKICELISKGLNYSSVAKEIENLGGHISKNMFYGLKRRDREYKKWTYLLDKYGIGVKKED